MPEAAELLPILQLLVNQYQFETSNAIEIGLNTAKIEEVLGFMENNLAEKISLEKYHHDHTN